MTTEVLLLMSFSFSWGIVVGVVVRAWWFERCGRITAAVSGHTDGVPTTPLRRNLIMVMAILAVLLGAAANVQLIANSRADSNRVSCNTEYNRIDGLARDARDARGQSSTASTLAFLLAIRAQTVAPATNPTEQQKRFLHTLDSWIRALQDIQSTRQVNPYPTPDACADGHITDDERVKVPVPKPTARPTSSPGARP